MKKILTLIILILSVQVVTAMYGGETEVIQHFDKCSSLKVDIMGTLPINKTEYTFLNCSETNENIWECDCFDGFDLVIETKVNTINNYLIEMTYSYSGEEIVYLSSGRSHNFICGDWSECIDGTKSMFCYKRYDKGINYTKTKECYINTTTDEIIIIKEPETDVIVNKTIEPDIKEPEVKDEKSYKLLIIILSILALLIITITLGIIKVKKIRRKQK